MGQFEFLTYCVAIQKIQTDPLPEYLGCERTELRQVDIDGVDVVVAQTGDTELEGVAI